LQVFECCGGKDFPTLWKNENFSPHQGRNELYVL
jgi:hypothetical protein